MNDEIAMRSILVLNRNESGRGRDLSPTRRAFIESEGKLRGFTIQGAMSLRRQLIREIAPKTFFTSRKMGDPQGATEHAAKFEMRVAEYLKEQGVQFMPEKQLKDNKYSLTPDFVLLGHVKINGTPVSWIDCKTFYGTSMLAETKNSLLPVTKLGKQAARYNAAFGNGAFVFLCGFSKDLLKSADLPANLVLLDATPIDAADLLE